VSVDPGHSAINAQFETTATIFILSPSNPARMHESVPLRNETFEERVADALASVPRRFRDAMRNIAIVVEDEPSSDLLDELGIEPPDTLFGLYQGIPLTERSWTDGNRLPDRILIFRGPHERAARNADDLVATIAETLIHEIGHYFGLSEEEIEEIEERYWHGDQTS
jgi:predicted Zn-dependent protease with MMP-like domain